MTRRRKSFSSDSRTSVAVMSDGSEAMVELHIDNTLVVLPTATIAVESSLASVVVSFPGTFAVSETASVRVVELASLSVSTQPCHSGGSFEGDTTVLSLVSCSGIYQRLQAKASVELSDGTQQTSADFYKRVAFTSSNTAIADFTSDEPSWSGMKRGLVASQAGQTIITGSFGGLSDSMTIAVEDTQVAIDGLTIADDVGSSSTLSVPPHPGVFIFLWTS